MPDSSYNEILDRFRECVDYVFSQQGNGNKTTFCKRNKIDPGNFVRALDNNGRKLQVEWIAVFCKEYGVSANWVLTGEV
jgi:hypothetical protein